MAIDPNQFEVIGEQPATDGRFELVGDEPPSLSKLGFDMSKVGKDPYDIYKLQESKAPALEDYSQAVPASQNPNYDFNRATGYGGPIAATFGLVTDAAGKGIVKLADIPTKIHNARIGASDPDSAFHRDTLEEREARGPILKFPRVDTKDLKGVPAVVAGLENTALGTAESFIGKPSSALMLPLLGGEGALAKTAAGVYGLSAAAQVPDAVKKAIDVYNDPDATTAEKTQAISDPIVQGTLSYLMLKHAGARETAGGVQGPYALGRMMKTPEGAEAPLQVERYEPLDVQSGSPLSPQELIARQSRVPTQPEVPTPEIKTHNLDEVEGVPNASEIPSTEGVPQSEVRPPVGEGTPLRQQGETPAAQGNEPVARTGDSRGATDEEASQIGKTPNADQLVARDYGDRQPEEIAALPDDEFKKLVEAKDDTGKARMSVTVDATAWALKHPDADPVKLDALRDQAIENQKKNGGYDRSQWFADAAHALRGNEVGSFNKDLVSKMLGIKTSEPANPELVGMGGAVPSEFNPGGNPGRDVYGIAHEVRQARERAGQVGEVERGEGISAKDSVEHGRQLLQSGTDPEKALANFEATGKWSSDDIAVTRAHGEELAKAARVTESKFGTNSPEYKAAFDKLTDWDTRTKKFQTEWHKAGQAQQGQTDIDTGSFTGIARELKSRTGKDLTPKQEKEAKNISGKVSDAADATEKAKNELFNQLDKESGNAPPDAERRALDAASKTVREAAASLAQTETKERVAVADADKKAARAERAKAQKVLDLATEQARDAAKRLADAENKRRIDEAKGSQDDTQSKAAQKALDAANKTARESAERMAKAEKDASVAKSDADKKAAQAAAKREKKTLDAANKAVRDAAARAAKAVREENVLKADTSAYAWKKAKEYIDKGITNFDDIRNGLATDMGFPVAKVTAALAKTKRAKFLTDELWKKQQEYRRLDQSAKRWLMEQEMPKIQKVIQALPNLAFAAKVFGHGTVALGTHAPMVAFQPPFWKAYANNFVKMYRMVGSPAFYEMQVQDLLRRPNYTTARRAGLVNDPYQFEDYNSPEVTKWMGPVANTGNRGYSVLKMLRQDMFDAQWNRLPKTQQISEVAAALADGINHATGVVRAKAPKGSNIALFAPRLEASRVAWLAADPARAVKAGLDWKNASEGEKMFAMNQVKEKAWVIGTMFALLAANEGILEATGSNQRVNMTDPMKRDWMKFKVGGMSIGYGNAMLSMARLPARLYRIRESNGGKLKNLVYPDEDTYSVLGEFARSQESPFASLATTLWFKSDWQNRPLPNSNRPVPKRLQARGVKPYTWPEFWTEQVLPIPLEEGAREVWKSGLGMSDQQVKQSRRAMATIAVMAATGARVEEDTDVAHP